MTDSKVDSAPGLGAGACIVCGGDDLRPFYSGLVKCAGCGFVAADMQLDENELRRLYQKNYFFGEEYSNYIADKKTLQKNFRLRLRSLFSCINRCCAEKKSKGRIDLDLFEIGSAYGFFLEEANKHFRSAAGMDISEDGCRHAVQSGLDVTCGDFLGADLNKKYDVFCMWDTIEHLSKPHLYIEKAAEFTNPGGLICVTTGNIDSFVARRKKERWRLIHPPTHLYYFSRKTLTKLLEKNGYEVIHFESCGFYRSLDNALYNIFVLRKKRPGWYNFFKKTGLTRLSFYLNLYDIMYLIARKK